MKIEITSEDHTTLIIALDFYIKDDLRLRRYESARKRIRQNIAIHRKLELAHFNSFAHKPLKNFAQLRAQTLVWKKQREARKATLAALESPTSKASIEAGFNALHQIAA